MMSAVIKWDKVSVEEYLADELTGRSKHEYVAGEVYAMAGARNVHNLIASNILGELYSRLRGRPCRGYNSDTKIRIQFPAHTRFYYPDALVVCRENPPNDSFQENPAVVVEVLSPRTDRIDKLEKKEAYLSLASLSAYLLVEQQAPKVLVYRRADMEFVREDYEGMSAFIPLPEIGIDLPLFEIYNSVEFLPETNSDESD
jgi:Uma2 family endonuclease